MNAVDVENLKPAIPKRIVIIGGGFAGVTLAQRLERILPPEIEVVVINAVNHLVFSPMLPEVVARSVSPLHVVVAGRELTKRARWIEGNVTSIDRQASKLHYHRHDGSHASMAFSHLVLACGRSADLLEIPGLAKGGYPLKTVVDAIVMGNDLIGNFEAAASENQTKVRERLLTVVVIGGGFSGVELAGHLADRMQAIRRFFPETNAESPRVVLIHKGEELLPELRHKSLSAFTLRKLKENGIEVRLNSEVEQAEDQAVQLNSGERIEAGMIVCTVGTATHPLIKTLELPLEKGRLRTNPDMSVPGTTNLWALGDCALVPNKYDGHSCPSTAQFATQQAPQLAQNLKLGLDGQKTNAFSFHPRGMLAAIGNHNAVADIYGVRLSGFFAWFLWRGVYLFKLPTLSRKVEVALNWACNIPFTPNIAELELSKREPTAADDQRASVNH